MPDEEHPPQALRAARPLAVGIDANRAPELTPIWLHRESHVYPHLMAQGFAVARLAGAHAVRGVAAVEAVRPEAAYLTASSHGRADALLDDHGGTLFGVGGYAPAEAAGKIIHFFACGTATTLGRDLVANGARAFFGYTSYFGILPRHGRLFYEADAEIDRAFADGLAADAVYLRAKAKFDANIASLEALGTEGGLYAAALLKTNLAYLACPSVHADWGDPTARLR